MKKLTLRGAVLLVALCCVAAGMASASPASINVPFPAAGDAFCTAVYGCGTLTVGGQTDPMWTAGDYVLSSVFAIANSTGVTGLSADWTFQNFLGGGNSTAWYVYVNGIPVASFGLADDNYNGDFGTVTGSVSFASIGPVGGGYQVAIVLLNTVPYGGGAVLWSDGGVTGLTYNTVPEPGSLMLFGSGAMGLAGLLRRKLGR